MADASVRALILAGGSGTRLWPRSTDARPKRFLALAGRLMRSVEDESLRAKYRSQLLRAWRARRFEPQLLSTYAVKTAMHYHYASITGALASAGDGPLPEAVRSFSRSPGRVPVRQVA